MPTDEKEAREKLIALAKTCSIHEPEGRPSHWLIRACCLVVLRRFAGEDFAFLVSLNSNMNAVRVVVLDGLFIGPTVWAALEEAGVPCNPFLRDPEALEI